MAKVNITTDRSTSPTKNVSSYSTHIFSGITSSGDQFIFDLNAEPGTTSWYVLETIGLTSAYVPYAFNPYMVEALTNVQEQTTGDKISIFKESVTRLLESTATYYGYDSIDNAISYYDSLDSTKREEARSFSSWRDSVEFLADVNIFSYTADGVTLPDLAGFTGQTGYTEFSVVPLQEDFFGNEDIGYQILPNTDNKFISWYNIEHTNNSYGGGVGEFINSGDISAIYSISATIDQTGLSASWADEDFSIKMRLTGTANDYGVQTDYEYKLGSVGDVFSGFSGLKVRINCFGKFN